MLFLFLWENNETFLIDKLTSQCEGITASTSKPRQLNNPCNSHFTKIILTHLSKKLILFYFLFYLYQPEIIVHIKLP